MTFAETQFSYVWITYSTNETMTEEAIIEYFEKTHNIDLKDVRSEMVNDDIFHHACVRPFGRELKVNLDEKFIFM